MFKYIFLSFLFFSSTQFVQGQSDSTFKMVGGNFLYYANSKVADVDWTQSMEERTSAFVAFPYIGKFYGEEQELFVGFGVGFSQTRQVSDKPSYSSTTSVVSATDLSRLVTFNAFVRRYYRLHPKLAIFGQLLAGGGLGTLETEIELENDANLTSFQVVGTPGVHFSVSETFGLELLYGGLGFTQIKSNYQDSNSYFAGSEVNRLFGLDFDKTSVRLGITFTY
ncbi:hypothetical protein [Tunicatimonas pelagia]|uniref:hypothetical protein n=1 Tax=Tunicatimonas pelagia TaxID=931531 RepID=UPI002666F283|nr:hypothetical protein [Tunicatimonas pelagia]WKN42534.1 hypothetical protein P0M28_26210 [Tunicatimonas pelagia]